MEKGKKNDYLDYLIQSLEIIKKHSIDQQGSSDIEPPDYVEQINRWYSKLFEDLEDYIIDYYVKELLIFEDENRDIKHMVLSYYTPEEPLNGVSIMSRRVL